MESSASKESYEDEATTQFQCDAGSATSPTIESPRNVILCNSTVRWLADGVFGRHRKSLLRSPAEANRDGAPDLPRLERVFAAPFVDVIVITARKRRGS